MFFFRNYEAIINFRIIDCFVYKRYFQSTFKELKNMDSSPPPHNCSVILVVVITDIAVCCKIDSYYHILHKHVDLCTYKKCLRRQQHILLCTNRSTFFEIIMSVYNRSVNALCYFGSAPGSRIKKHCPLGDVTFYMSSNRLCVCIEGSFYRSTGHVKFVQIHR